MELVVANGTLTSASVARLIAVGWFFGFGAIGLVVLIFLALVGPLVAGLSNQLHLPTPSQLLGLVMLPVILALQAVAVGAIGALGVSVYGRYRRIELKAVPTPPNGASL